MNDALKIGEKRLFTVYGQVVGWSYPPSSDRTTTFLIIPSYPGLEFEVVDLDYDVMTMSLRLTKFGTDLTDVPLKWIEEHSALPVDAVNQALAK
jgi:hypothetical protein